MSGRVCGTAVLRRGTAVIADELSETADAIDWPRMSELKDFEDMPKNTQVASYFSLGELIDTSFFQRTQLYKRLLGKELPRLK